MTVTRLSEILIIEDNEDHLALTMEALEDAGLRNPIRTAGSLRQARAYLEQCAAGTPQGDGDLPCVILLDVRLPDGSGMEVLREIRQHPRLGTTPVVVLTSSDHTPDINRAYQCGANSYLVKPISFEQFHHKVREAGLYWAVLNERDRPEVGD
jgi:CheY-like chemotaxis protein